MSVLQTGTEEVSIFVQEDGAMNKLSQKTDDVAIKGLAVGQTCFIVWSGQWARVFQVDQIAQRSRGEAKFPTSSHAIAIADHTHISDDAVFIAEDKIVKITNFAGVEKQKITFSATEGDPKLAAPRFRW